ncbi:NADPH-dependent FMN reductase [Parvibium lacunae]|uniref:FMN reductase (NADPH) n=1 Tax=Parvibium lacunae TaxID=1888893 RepID=A0A368L3J9_9BURK|nr:NADPH-dependent FMN reductase [Parvibium lacunae]RCS58157.1 FMN reductase (NADPH) [Parvibium lacunae]
MTILLIAGSPTSPSRSARLLSYVGDRLSELGHQLDQLNVRDLPSQPLLHADFSHPAIKIAQNKVALADAVVIATPVYKAAYSGVLKAFLDLLPQTGLAGKLVLPLATGGSLAHMLALDYGLRPVLSSLAARQVLPSVYAVEQQVQWSEEAGLTLDPEIELRLQDSVQRVHQTLTFASTENQAWQTTVFEPVNFQTVRCST